MKRFLIISLCSALLLPLSHACLWQNFDGEELSGTGLCRVTLRLDTPVMELTQ
ncbi:hypothetical protein [Alistipes ihumii]|uniref:hypothetical protein n=1 Tax=Alistipes ihumii TaxID=1470347 RepID=UPI003AB7B31C